jgi:hypothetical protein
MRKIFILSVLLSIVSFTIAQKWDGTTKTPVTPNKNIYTITNGAELAWVAQQCNDGTQDFKGRTILIAEDIDLDNHEWTPIGTADHPFKGNVIGNWKVISNLFISGTNDYVGLLGYASGDNDNHYNTIATISIENVDIKGGTAVGAIAGFVKFVAFDSCSVIEGTVEGNTAVGGFVGHCSYAAAMDCFAKVDVTANTTYGGGFVGINDTSNVRMFINYAFAKGKVTGPGTNGGFVGLNNNKVKSAYTVTNPINGATFGGFCGENSDTGKFENCYFCNSYTQGIQGIGKDLGNVDEHDMLGNASFQMTQDGFVGTGSGNGLNGADYGKTHWSTDFKSPHPRINDGHPILTWFYTLKYDSTASITSYTSAINIYPNPIKNELRIKTENIVVERVEIVDLLGKAIITLKSGFEFIDVNHLNNGIYFVKIYTNNDISTRKVIKQ